MPGAHLRGAPAHGFRAGYAPVAAQKKETDRQKRLPDFTSFEQGIIVRAPNEAAIADEAPDVYKPSSEVVEVVARAGLSALVARLTPIGVIKG